MAYRKRTLRSMLPVTRKLARLIGEQESVARRFKNLIPEISRLELDSRALVTAKQQPQCFTVNSKDLFDESKNPGLSLSVKDVLANPNIPKRKV